MNSKKASVTSFVITGVLIPLGIFLRNHCHSRSPLYVCHLIGGSLLLFGLVNLFLPEGPPVRTAEEGPRGER